MKYTDVLVSLNASFLEIVADDVETRFVRWVRSTRLESFSAERLQLRLNANSSANRIQGMGEKISNPVMSRRNKTSGFTNHGVLHIEGLATNAIGRQDLDR